VSDAARILLGDFEEKQLEVFTNEISKNNRMRNDTQAPHAEFGESQRNQTCLRAGSARGPSVRTCLTGSQVSPQMFGW
jgi:hypothetical protein